jgi:uridine kinase|tara:strand:+ start:1368 stop:1982 length:615 start_codon:yes stop_codon:yes gene_type:complete
MQPTFIAISGGTGSGKTYLSKLLINELGPEKVIRIELDSYYKSKPNLEFIERENLNYDHPESIDIDLLKMHLNKLSKNQKILMPRYNFSEHLRSKELKETLPTKIVIVEGILVLHFVEIFNFFNLKIFLDIPGDIRFIRRLKRDTKERGRSLDSIMNQYLETVEPMYRQFIAPCEKLADLIISDQNDISNSIQKIKLILSEQEK